MDEQHDCQGREQNDRGRHEQVQWCPAWDLWLCAQCRFKRNETELKIHHPLAGTAPMQSRPDEPQLVL